MGALVDGVLKIVGCVFTVGTGSFRGFGVICYIKMAGAPQYTFHTVCVSRNAHPVHLPVVCLNQGKILYMVRSCFRAGGSAQDDCSQDDREVEENAYAGRHLVDPVVISGRTQKRDQCRYDQKRYQREDRYHIQRRIFLLIIRKKDCRDQEEYREQGCLKGPKASFSIDRNSAFLEHSVSGNRPMEEKDPLGYPLQTGKRHEKKDKKHQVAEDPPVEIQGEQLGQVNGCQQKYRYCAAQPEKPFCFSDICKSFCRLHDRSRILPCPTEDAELPAAVDQLPSGGFTIFGIFLRTCFWPGVHLRSIRKDLNRIINVGRVSLFEYHPQPKFLKMPSPKRLLMQIFCKSVAAPVIERDTNFTLFHYRIPPRSLTKIPSYKERRLLPWFSNGHTPSSAYQCLCL